jgi:hypothetical protein
VKRVGSLLALLVLAFVVAGLWLWVPASLPNQMVSEEVAEVVSRSLPLDVTWKSMTISLSPATITFEGCELRAKAGDPLLMTATRIVVELEAGSLDAAMPRIERVSVETPRLQIDRTLAGWSPWDPLRGDEAEGKGQLLDKKSETAKQQVVEHEEMALPSFNVKQGTIVLLDKTLEPSMEWGLENLQIAGVRDSAKSKYSVEGRARFSAGGVLEAKGTIADDGDYEIHLSLSDLIVAPLARYSPAFSGLRGPVSGSLSVEGVRSGWQSLAGELDSPKASVKIEEIRARGSIGLTFRLRPGPSGGALGTFDLDATGAALNVANSYRKPAGAPAQVEGTFIIAPDGKAELDQVHLAIRKKKSQPPPSNPEPSS